ncbi:hypothetical protein H6A71_05950 [Bifidobacterium pullorum subsp. saeculare]|uniref:hypothetical protein n=1 Tax=Bifidobacterium pullorum TaxID=78448 RepID=UPI0019589583|nr:hypothetical protein [Bifidobacterium pullorum]MBM6692608.1 hypothetical protein [Bifidobacterium pullorum subsp. saeculare]
MTRNGSIASDRIFDSIAKKTQQQHYDKHEQVDALFKRAEEVADKHIAESRRSFDPFSSVHFD